MAADWSELPNDILFSIAKRTDHLSDYIRFGAVCKSWESALIENPRPLHLGFPLLFLSRKTTTTTTTNNNNNRPDHALYSPFERKLHPIRLPDRPRPQKCIGSSSDGWVCIVDNNFDLYLLNPFNGAVIILPPLKTGRDGSPEFQFDDGGIEVVVSGESIKDVYLYKAVFPSEPTDPNCIIVLLWWRNFSMVYCRPGDKQWKVIKTSLGYVSDAIFYKENLYVVGYEMGIVGAHYPMPSFLQETMMPNFVVIDPDVVYDPEFDSQRYLVASPSGLLVIMRHLIPDEEEMFEIFKLDETETKWVKINSFDDGMLFLGLNTSMWVSSRNFKECKGNYIYFTDDDMTDSLYKTSPVEDSGIFNLEDISFESIYGDDLRQLYPYPVWVVPNP